MFQDTPLVTGVYSGIWYGGFEKTIIFCEDCFKLIDQKYQSKFEIQ